MPSILAYVTLPQCILHYCRQMLPHSSLPSSQSLYPLHFQSANMHWPLSQAKPPPQLAPHTSVVSSLPSRQSTHTLHFDPSPMHPPSEQAHLPATFSQFAPQVSVVSSLPSSQFLIPSHLCRSGMHWVTLEQANLPATFVQF